MTDKKLDAIADALAALVTTGEKASKTAEAIAALTDDERVALSNGTGGGVLRVSVRGRLLEVRRAVGEVRHAASVAAPTSAYGSGLRALLAVYEAQLAVLEEAHARIDAGWSALADVRAGRRP